MKKLKNEKGITMVALAVTIVVLSLISVPIIINTSRIKEFEGYKKLKEDIDTLSESVSTAFFDDDISKVGPTYNSSLDFLTKTQNGETVKNSNDNNVYYVISIDNINERLSSNIRKLNYGVENSNTGNSSNYYGTDDVYIINAVSRTIYYVQGISYNGSTYYRLA